jgi:septation ring formation regulator EzrA
MEQIAAFVLGVSAVTFVWVVAVAFRTANLAKQNEESIRNVEEWISRNDELVNRRIDQEIERVDNLHKDSISYTDSRADKLDSKIENNKHLLKG